MIGTTSTKVWDLASGQTLLTISPKVELDAYSPHAYSPQSFIMAIANQKNLGLWNTTTGIQEVALHDHNAKITAIAFSPDGTRMASGDANGTLLFWDANTGQKLQELYGHFDYIQFLQFSPDGKTLVSRSADGTIRFWYLEGK